MRFGKRARDFSIPGALLLLLLGLGLLPQSAVGQVDYGARLGRVQSEFRRYEPQGPVPLLEAVDPAMRKWYRPQEAYADYRWRQWETTNYARDPYQRYVETSLEGDFFYDLYGNLLNRGWLIYNISQTNPLEGGHVLFESPRLNEWFSNIIIASESKGQYRYALTIGSDLRTILTPMVFAKPRFSGVQLDFLTDKYKSTLIYSQGGIGGFDEERPRTNVTTIMGGRFAAQVGDFVEVGVHMANAHQSNSLNNRLVDNLISGSLTEPQNQVISSIEIVLRDDSPEDGTGGALYFPAGSDVIIRYRDGGRDSAKEMRFEPLVQGGTPGQGFIAANGRDEIRLSYDFAGLDFASRARADRSEIVGVEFRLTLANDYQIWMTSDRQADSRGKPVLLIVDRAAGNVSDASNLRLVQFEYGLPTATNLIGGSLQLSDAWGFDFYGEYDMGWSYRKYPNPLAERHEVSSGILGKRTTPAWMLNLGKQAQPFFLYGEAYSVDPLYNTQTFVTNLDGSMDYAADRLKMELVEDNDDQDRFPDAFRFDTVALDGAGGMSAVDTKVFPGWDRNNDFLPDFNQNDNRIKPNSIPDYEEPFLRFSADRPEFLFGADMNHNFWIDYFENDEEPDYPYRRDRRGFNLFGGLHLSAEMQVKAGVLREEEIASDRRNHSNYGVLEYASTSRWGRLRLFEMVQLARDDIADPLLQWAPDNSFDGGKLTLLQDPLLARHAWINHSFAGHSWQRGSLSVQNKLSYIYFGQRLDQAERLLYRLDKSDFFFGLINKASYGYRLGPLDLIVRWKSEFIDQSRNLFSPEPRTTLSELFSGLVTMPLLRTTELQGGVEYMRSQDFKGRADDFATLSTAVQITNRAYYLGYVMWSVMGFVVERTDPKGQDSSTSVQSFITVYAGLERKP